MASKRTPEKSAAVFEDASVPSQPATAQPAAAQGLNRRNLPKVEESVQAQSLAGSPQCMLTPGCDGIIRVYSSNRRVERGADGSRTQVTQQYLRCVKCGRCPVNPRLIEQDLGKPEAAGKLFDRRKPKAD